jgi:hypothetical protein
MKYELDGVKRNGILRVVFDNEDVIVGKYRGIIGKYLFINWRFVSFDDIKSIAKL